MPKTPKPCREAGCEYLKFAGKQRCFWHYALAQPIEWQVARADARRAQWEGEPVSRISPDRWPAGERWCSGCQSFVPLFYCQGSRCKACQSRAAHERHVEKEYGIPAATYHRLMEWQQGRCFICRRKPRSRRLAVDHDHETGIVRGLLCADNDRGCNHAILGNITSIDMARRIVAYLERTPLERLHAGEPLPAIADVGEEKTKSKLERTIRMPPSVPEQPGPSSSVSPGSEVNLDSPVAAPESAQERPAGVPWTADPAWDF